MKYKVLKSESKILGRNILRLYDWNSALEIVSGEDEMLSKGDPAYVYCEVPATDLNSIHILEEAGYRFSEFRVVSMLKTEQAEEGPRGLYPFVADIIAEKDQLKVAINMLLAVDDDDRFSKDPLVDMAFSKERVVKNLKKSFRSWPQEFLLGVFNYQTEELIAFRSGNFLSKTEAHYYQYGVSPAKDFDHTAEVMEALTIDYLKKQGVNIIYSVSSGFNISELNRLTQNHGFKIISSQVILRKVFN